MNETEKMIQFHLKDRDIKDIKVIGAMRSVDRKIFVPEHVQHLAYEDTPLPIGKGQTIVNLTLWRLWLRRWI